MGVQVADRGETAIAELRRRIDEVDTWLLSLLNERAALARRIGREKDLLGIGRDDPDREREVIERVRDRVGSADHAGDLVEVFRLVVGMCRRVQGRATACVVGGMGAMGSLLVRLLEGSGLRTLVLDPPRGVSSPGALESSDLVFVAVPMRQAEAVVEEACGAMRADSILVETSSVKQPIGRVLERCCRGSFLSCHPMFGPGTEPVRGETVFLCGSGGDPALVSRVEGLMSSWELVIVRMAAEEHDELMSRVQVTRPAVLLSAGLAMCRSGLPGLDEARLGRSSRLLLELVRHQVAESPDLLVDMAARNRFVPGALDDLAGSFGTVLDAFRRPGRELEELLAGAADALGLRPPSST
ncbi:prephenate dehydrogenase/arogenate dehydrogenase family protein [Candidatus Fermentibacterales bacterium]|nr:prephenate dehydrogenase/arogenate dehydrogenase family protein [Candidatus Fermentibacterales bacterium]